MTILYINVSICENDKHIVEFFLVFFIFTWSYVKSDGMNILRSFRYVNMKCFVSTNHMNNNYQKLHDGNIRGEVKRV